MKKLAALIILIGLLGVAAPAQAANLTQVTGFGSNPGNLSMYYYRPDGLGAGHPLVVLLHGCTQDASGYFANSGWRKYADQYKFALVLPQTSTANQIYGCLTWYENGDINRGQGEALSIRNMIGYAVSNGADPQRTFVSGLSAGGAMSAVMMAAYPEVFAAGSIAAGLPYKCATSSTQTSTCQYTGVDKTPQQWGDLVRNAAPGGPYPRVAIWQGLSDPTVVPKNATELIDQWTNVRGASQTPTSTQTLPGGVSLQVFGANDVRAYRITGMGHGLPVDPGSAADQCGSTAAYFLDTICSAYHDVVFFGLTTGPPNPNPTPTPTPTATPAPSPTSAPVCVTATNYAHTQAGHAHQQGGYTYANGSNQFMGLWNVYATTILRQTGPNYWVIGC